MKHVLFPTGLLLFVVLITGCINPQATVYSNTGRGWYQVKPTDTLYSIAWRYDLDYKEIAAWNRIDVNAVIYPGQRLLLIDPGNSKPQVATISTPTSGSGTNKTQEVTASVDKTNKSPSTVNNTASTSNNANPGEWLWPTKGKLLSTFSAKQLDRRGIDIEGEPGQAIYAVASGKVVYSGNGLAGYGNLIIIKHSDAFLSAYAYSQERLVKEGMIVEAGREIAKMGKHKSRTARLHFQIRKDGKPVDPLQYLPKR